MKGTPTHVRPMEPMELAVSQALDAVCGYARSEGKHVCGKNACDLNDWQGVRRAVAAVWLAGQAHLLRQYAADPPSPELAAATLEHVECQLRLIAEQGADAPACRGCPAWIPCEGRTNNEIRAAS